MAPQTAEVYIHPVVMPGATPVAMPIATPATKRPISIWWPMSFLIAWVVFSVIGGALVGTAAGDCETGYGCTYATASIYNGGLGCLGLSGLLGCVFWSLLVVWLVQRRHLQATTSPAPTHIINTPGLETGMLSQPWSGPPQHIVYTNYPPTYATTSTAPQYPPNTNYQPNYATTIPAPQYPPNTNYQPNYATPSPAPQHPPEPSTSPAPIHHTVPRKPCPTPLVVESQEVKYCGHCGAAVSTPFCTQCGIRS